MFPASLDQTNQRHEKDRIDEIDQMNETKQVIRMARLVKASEQDRSFDLVFWKKVGAEGRFEAAWQMVSEVQAIKGKGHMEEENAL